MCILVSFADTTESSIRDWKEQLENVSKLRLNAHGRRLRLAYTEMVSYHGKHMFELGGHSESSLSKPAKMRLPIKAIPSKLSLPSGLLIRFPKMMSKS